MKDSKLEIYLNYAMRLDAENRDDWVRACGKAVRLWRDDPDFGCHVFDLWSSQASNYQGTADCEKLFYGFITKKTPTKYSVEDRYQNTAIGLKIEGYLSKCQPADPSHPYLFKKQCLPMSIYQKEDVLVVPLSDCFGKYTSIQFIAPCGRKRFAKGTKIRGSSVEFSDDFSNTVYVAEGYATANSIFSVTKCMTFAAMTAHNVKAVVAQVREAYKDFEIVIAADNDAHPTKPNIGVNVAKDAARLVDGAYVIPMLNEDPSIKCDFNDVCVKDSWKAAIDQLDTRYMV